MVPVFASSQDPIEREAKRVGRQHLYFYQATKRASEPISHRYKNFHSANLFNPEGIELYDSKKVTKEYLQEQLVSLLSLPEGYLTREEFISFYDDLSVNYPHDEPFIKYVSKQWNYTAPKNEAITEEYLKEIIKSLRYKLIQKSKGTYD